MAKSEYHDPKLLDGEVEQPGILVDAVALLELYLRALPMMNATDRKRYGDRAVDLILDVIAAFQMAYDFEEDREMYIRELCRATSKFIFLSRVIGEVNAINIELEHERMSPSTMRLEIFRRTAALDEGVTKWRRSIFGVRKRNGARLPSGDGSRHPINKGDSAASSG